MAYRKLHIAKSIYLWRKLHISVLILDRDCIEVGNGKPPQYHPKNNYLDVVVRESELTGLSINCKKTECMVISKKEGYSKVQSESERPDNQAGLCF